jgi:FlaA1/EpsC-like NDP-sugar epimerase
LRALTIRSPENPHGDIEIVVVGKRPGEKLYEELFYDEATAARTKHPKILRAQGAPVDADGLKRSLEDLARAIDTENEALARNVLFDLIRERMMLD